MNESAVKLVKQQKQLESQNNMDKARTRQRVEKRIRMKLRHRTDRPRLSVFRSSRYVYAQIIDDTKGITIVGASEKQLKETEKKGTPIDRSRQLGMFLAKEARAKKITKVAFDKGRYAYHGRVKALAEGAREGGLQF